MSEVNNKTVQKIATREAYGKALAEFGAQYPNLVVLDADLANATKTNTFQKAFPERHIDCGIAECDMMGPLPAPLPCSRQAALMSRSATPSAIPI